MNRESALDFILHESSIHGCYTLAMDSSQTSQFERMPLYHEQTDLIPHFSSSRSYGSFSKTLLPASRTTLLDQLTDANWFIQTNHEIHHYYTVCPVLYWRSVQACLYWPGLTATQLVLNASNSSLAPFYMVSIIVNDIGGESVSQEVVAWCNQENGLGQTQGT